jgi:predicted secreted hydrolase
LSKVKRYTLIFVGLLTISLLIVLVAVLLRHGEPEVQAQLVAIEDEATGFARAKGPRPLQFPADHGPHPDYQTEWWYYTGNLENSDGRHFGYQLTFFRRALVPPAQRQDRSSNWATDQVYMAHFALTDVAGRRHQAFERFARGAAGLASAEAAPYRVWLEDWSVEEVEPNVVHLCAAQEDLALDLLLIDGKGPVLQGDGGYSQKGPEPGNASYYYSQTRLETWGTVQVGDTLYQMDGLSWMDHEFSTSALGPDQVGWDWFALQLDDDSELMVFQIRKADGSVDPFSSGTLVALDGSTRHLSHEDFEIGVGATWRSPRSGATYPARWTVEVPAADLTLEIEPYLADQELNVSYTYWEGAVRISGEQAGSAISGSGYVEMTGYAGSMQGQF